MGKENDFESPSLKKGLEIKYKEELRTEPRRGEIKRIHDIIMGYMRASKEDFALKELLQAIECMKVYSSWSDNAKLTEHALQIANNSKDQKRIKVGQDVAHFMVKRFKELMTYPF